MAPIKIQTVCGYSCSDCEHNRKECPGCAKIRGRPFWTAYVQIETCPVYDCCVNEKKLAHCGKCPELMCERFSRFRNPDVSGEEQAVILAAMEKELRGRK